MSGTYQLDGQLFPKNPLSKRWAGTPIGRRGTREPILSNIWRLEMQFGILESAGQSDFFSTRFANGGLYTAVLPHPATNRLTGFSGVSIDAYSFELTDVDRDYYADSVTLSLSVDIRATGIF